MLVAGGGDSGSTGAQGAHVGVYTGHHHPGMEKLESELTLREPEQLRDVKRSLDGIETPTTPGRITPVKTATLDRISEIEELLYEETVGNTYAAAVIFKIEYYILFVVVLMFLPVCSCTSSSVTSILKILVLD